MPTVAERRDLRHGGSGGKFEPYQTFGRDLDNPALRRLQGLSGGFGTDYQGALGMQQGMFDQYGAMAAGEGPSLAQAQLQQGMQQASQAAVQQALAARGGNAAGVQAVMGQVGASMGGQAATQAAMLRQQEQLAAMQAQAGLASQMAGQGLQGQLGLEGMYQDQLGTIYQGDIDYRLGSRGLREQERMGHNERIRKNVGAATGGIAGDTGGGAIGGIGGAIGGALSDERVKRNIRPGNLAASQAVGALDPYTFEYEAGLDPTGATRLGVMAQDLERVMPQAVADTPNGKMIRGDDGLGLALASSAEQEQRLRKIEAALAGAGPSMLAQGQPAQRGYDPAINLFQGFDGRRMG